MIAEREQIEQRKRFEPCQFAIGGVMAGAALFAGAAAFTKLFL